MKNILRIIDERLEDERLSYHRLSDVGRGLLAAKQIVIDYLKKNQSIDQEVAKVICDKYCRFSEVYDSEERMHKERCSVCPLERLLNDVY